MPSASPDHQAAVATTDAMRTRHRAVHPFLAMAVLYALWLAWLAYVAWVNVGSGQQ